VAAGPKLIVDDTSGADPAFAAELAGTLRAEGFDVELRKPNPGAFFDTSVHFVADGVAVRVFDELDRATLDRVVHGIQESERRRPQRKRFRAVPVYRAETSRAIRFVDIFDGEG
jgi:hypothetical protein